MIDQKKKTYRHTAETGSFPKKPMDRERRSDSGFCPGEKQILAVGELTEHGAYLVKQGDLRSITAKDAGSALEKVLLPKRYLPAGAKKGDSLEVFIYLDSEDRPVATTDEPLITLHGISRLKVKETGRIGAFLDWGLPKDLLLPFANQTRRVKKGDEVLCALILDKSGRLAATMNVYEYLENTSPYKTGDWVHGTAYETSGEFGVFVAVDDRYSGLIPKKELNRDVTIGEKLRVRVMSVKEDGRLALSLRDKAWLQMDTDADAIMKKIEEDGFIPFTDKADPAVIKETFGMSKNEFKRAVGRLLKKGKISIEADRIAGL